MIYEIVLKSGTVVKCFAENLDNVLEMMLRHDIYIVAENSHPKYSSYIKPDDVDYLRFPLDSEYTTRPVK
ncbi:hypothetical protein D7X33_31130 [Butyricicoccus sp. 1XD8-22]|nr:hypothetical protein D7X33_31130 [Butyricicoccus sp. 1XD8-22]